MPNDPFDRIDKLKEEKKAQEEDLLRKTAAEKTRYDALEKMRKAHIEKLDRVFEESVSIFDKALHEFGSRAWGFKVVKSLHKNIWGTKEDISQEPRFSIFKVEISQFNGRKSKPCPEFRYLKGVFNTDPAEIVYGQKPKNMVYFIAPTTWNTQIASSVGEFSSIEYNGKCIVGMYSSFEWYLNDDHGVDYDLHEFTICPIEHEAIKEALADIYIKTNS